MTDTAQLELPSRLQAIADWVPEGVRLADIGTDHGYLPIWLLQRRRIASAIAADIGEQPLLRAVRSSALYGVPMDFRQCDGLRGISPDEVDVIVVAGMGGETIAHILQEAPWTRGSGLLLLQPMSKAETLRLWLAENGYQILRERLVLDRGVIYPIIQASGGEMPRPTMAQACYGYSGDSDPLFADYLRYWIQRTRRAIEGLRASTNQEIEPRRRDMERLLEELELRSGERP